MRLASCAFSGPANARSNETAVARRPALRFAFVSCIDEMDSSSSRLNRHRCARVAPGEGNKEEPVEKNSVVAVDIAKSVFDLAGSDQPGRVTYRRRLSRGAFLTYIAQLPASTIVMEACGSAHYWARENERLGHAVVLLPPHQVRPYVTRNKTDRTDAKGILEAYRNADIRPVPVKSVAQQVLCS